MDKHHKSEIKLPDTGKYNVKCGTINKNNPEVLYIRTKIKVKPSDKKTTYFSEITGIKNKFVRNVKSIIINDDTISNDYIFHFDANEKGMVYTVENPLFIGRTKTKEYYGESLQDLKKQYSGKFESITRAKGLGEIDAPLLKRVAFDPNTRNLQRITQVTDKELKKFFKIVGDDPELRKIFLKEI